MVKQGNYYLSRTNGAYQIHRSNGVAILAYAVESYDRAMQGARFVGASITAWYDGDAKQWVRPWDLK